MQFPHAGTKVGKARRPAGDGRQGRAGGCLFQKPKRKGEAGTVKIKALRMCVRACNYATGKELFAKLRKTASHLSSS
jgi:hypothetical protein